MTVSSFVVYMGVLLGIASLVKASQSPAENFVQAFSEGSDCRCKCILSTRDGGPCDSSRTDGPRKTLYMVETISGGRDCRCSCNTPPPSGCETMPKSSQQSATEAGEHPSEDLHKPRIDLVELHSSISNMVSALVKLEKAVQKESSKRELGVLRENVQKVVSDLKSTNGTYQDLLSDLELDPKKTNTSKSSSSATASEPDISTPPLQAPTRVREEERSDNVTTPAPTRGGLRENSTHLRQRFLTDIRRMTSKRKPVVATDSPVNQGNNQTQIQETASKLSGRTGNVAGNSDTQEEFDIGISFDTIQQPLATTSTKTTNTAHATRGTTRTKATIPLTPSQFQIAASTGSKVTTVELKPQLLVKPKLIFFHPYNHVEKPDPDFDTGQTGTKNQDDIEYDYNYDDEEDTADVADGTEEPIPDDARAEDATTVMTEKVTYPVNTTVEETTTPIPTNVTATTAEKDTDDDVSYEEYYDDDFEYDDYDQYYEDDSVSPVTTPKTVTTRQATRRVERCGTLRSLSKPRLVSHFGRKEGAWMRDPISSKNDPQRHKRIYIANFYYGNILIEYDSVEELRKLRWRNSYHLPHKYIGTGHIVYNGSFYYNRAFSRSLIKYNLQYRFVSAWSHLTNAVYDPSTPFTWRGHSMVHMAADEDGLWVIYPSQDPFDPNAKLTYVINKINPVDLRPIKSFKSKIRQSVSHVFMACGVVYSTDRYNARHGRVTHAFDTRTSVQRSFYLGFENMFSYSVQLLYNPKERKLYAWDDGRQVEYMVNMVF